MGLTPLTMTLYQGSLCILKHQWCTRFFATKQKLYGCTIAMYHESIQYCQVISTMKMIQWKLNNSTLLGASPVLCERRLYESFITHKLNCITLLSYKKLVV